MCWLDQTNDGRALELLLASCAGGEVTGSNICHYDAGRATQTTPPSRGSSDQSQITWRKCVACREECCTLQWRHARLAFHHLRAAHAHFHVHVPLRLHSPSACHARDLGRSMVTAGAFGYCAYPFASVPRFLKTQRSSPPKSIPRRSCYECCLR